MAGLVPAIHVSLLLVVCKQDVDARDERGHDESGGFTMMDLELLRSFVSVVDAGGFTRAGERVHRTQSTVSQQIRRLEETLGYPLLHRNGKAVALTEQGERLLSYARRILALAEEAREVVTKP